MICIPEDACPLWFVPFTALICDPTEINIQNIQTSFRYRISLMICDGR